MKSTLVEFARSGGLGTGMLRKGDPYLRAIGSREFYELRMLEDHYPFGELIDKLRYRSIEEQDRVTAIATVSDIASILLCKHLDNDKQYIEGHLMNELSSTTNIQQLDLVPNASELAMIPFEGALLEDGSPIFLHGDGVVITRRVRGDFEGEKIEWPSKPRLLFVWTEGGGTVPHIVHRELLLSALEPWMPPQNQDSVFVEVENAEIDDLRKAVENGSFTHIHILAHGNSMGERRDERFGIAFRDPADDSKEVVSPDELVQILSPQLSSAVTITIAACDGGNQADTVNPKKSLAHELHVSGFPIVIASQFPLAKPGSCELAKHFYHELFGGRDVRQAIHRVRKTLYEKQGQTGHDWISLVSYVELPEGYDDILERVHLDSTLAALKNLRDRTEAMKDPPESEVRGIKELFKTRIDSLQQKLDESEQQKDNPNAKEWLKDKEEYLGLIGSAEKRVAEFIHNFQEFGDSKIESRSALERSRNRYLKAFQGQPTHHWSAVQYLAIDAALNGKVNKEHWTVAYRAAEVARHKPDEYWALGSLAELALLAPIADVETDLTAEEYLEEMKSRVKAQDKKPSHDPFRSTQIQFLRYKNWWRQDLGFFQDAPDLSQKAELLARLLPGNIA